MSTKFLSLSKGLRIATIPYTDERSISSVTLGSQTNSVLFETKDGMDKRPSIKFWAQLHESIGNQLNLNPSQVNSLRQHLARGLTIMEMAQWYVEKLSSPKDKRAHNRKWYQGCLSFIASANAEQWRILKTHPFMVAPRKKRE